MNYSDIDWTLKDVEIARELGVAPSTVGRARFRLGKTGLKKAKTQGRKRVQDLDYEFKSSSSINLDSMMTMGTHN